MKNQKSKSKVVKHFNRTRQITKVLSTCVGSAYAAHKIDAFREPPMDILPKYLQIFCRKISESFGIAIVEVEPVEKRHGLWVSNHTSWLDIAVMGVSGAFFVAKSDIEQWPIFGKIAKAGGTLFIHRGTGDSTSISNQIAEFLSQGSSVIFFPEATTTNGHKIKKLHGKLLQAAMKTGLPIQPIVICYANKDGTISTDTAYCDNMTMKDSMKRVLDCQDVTAYVLQLEAIYPEDKTQDELTDILQEAMQAGLTRLQKQVLTVKPRDAIWD